MSTLLDGKFLAGKIKEEIREKCVLLKQKHGIVPVLAIIIAGNDPASHIYVSNKERACLYSGIRSITVQLDEKVSEDELISEVRKLAADDKVDGLMVQLPLPRGINEKNVLDAIPPEKDVDGLTTRSGGQLLFGMNGFTPCTPSGIMSILKYYGIKLQGKHAVVVGRSNMVGKPIALKLLENNCTVTICHSKTENLALHTRLADILVVAVGKKHLITSDMVKKDAVVIDVGINREDGRLYGDVDFDNVSKTVSYITPVPGGVGPLTVTMLLENAFKACLKRHCITDIPD